LNPIRARSGRRKESSGQINGMSSQNDLPMTNKILIGVLCGAFAGIGWLMRDVENGQAFAQVSTETAQGRCQLIKGRSIDQESGDITISQLLYVLLDTDTGIISFPVDDLGKEVFLFPSEPFKITTNGKGTMYVLNPGSGSVWSIDRKNVVKRVMDPIRNFGKNGTELPSLTLE